ncbi:hypothetical protein [Glycomyces buryatensis]|uniref:SH3 domain-containing protein n=1 Tax=Glycomyces buryatensis TaxID=2570927 RepID=A0A4V4HQZ8_9ACTN|nr:hypothetical protein [Glycomyces buryatensis]THV35616.1 hypothetical protein FAB82_22325 [Glycomyces buryatensis]
MGRTKVFGALAVFGAAVALFFATAAPVAAEETELLEPDGSISASTTDIEQSDAEEVNCAAATDRTEVRIREAPSTDSAIVSFMESGVWYYSACDSTPGGEYGGDCGAGFHWLEVYIGDTVGYVALLCLDGWVEVDV